MKKKTASTKVRMDFRVEKDVAEGIQKLASSVGISVNQLLHGSCRWILEYAHAGEPFRDPDGKIRSRELEGCFWFGVPACDAPEHLVREHYEERGEPVPPLSEDGEFYGFLDFTDRRVVRRDFADYT